MCLLLKDKLGFNFQSGQTKKTLNGGILQFSCLIFTKNKGQCENYTVCDKQEGTQVSKSFSHFRLYVNQFNVKRPALTRTLCILRPCAKIYIRLGYRLGPYMCSVLFRFSF